MENQKVSTKSIMINYGALLGLVLILINVIVYAMGNSYDQHWSIGLISFAVMIILIVLGIKKVKELNDGFLKISEALKVGLGIALISGVLSVIYTFIFTNYIEPDFFTNMMAIQEQKWMDAGLSDQDIENALELTKKMSGPMISSALSIVASVFFGFIISVITGAIMKRTDEVITSI